MRADHRVFDHGHDQATARLTDLDVLEQAGLDQRLEAVIDTRLIEAPAGPWFEIGADSLDLDTPVPFDLNRRNGLCEGWRRHKRSSDRRSQHDQGGQHTPPHPHSHIHAQRALIPNAGSYPYEPAESHSLPCL